MVSSLKPEIALNKNGQTVADALNAFITQAATGHVGGATVNIATAYFNVAGYMLLADSLGHANHVRLLLGAEPTPPENRQRKLETEHLNPVRAEKAKLRDALNRQDKTIRIERDMLGFTAESTAATRRLLDWLNSGKVEVRRLEKQFLHGKAFLVSDHQYGVIAGSSNFTYAGLRTNIELNLANYQPHIVSQVSEWFENIWAQATDYDLASLFQPRFEPHKPQIIYLRMLYELYANELQEEAASTGNAQIHLTDFQSDGLWRARRILDEHNGVLIADEVGLGKTFIAGELIRETIVDLRQQKVLVVAPATLRDGPWRAFRSDHDLHVELRSYDDLVRDGRLNPAYPQGRKLDARDINDYALVVVDEAHNLRNHNTLRAQTLRKLLAGSPPKKLVMLTATPVNNSLWDLYNLLDYFLPNDAVFADVGIRSLRDHFKHAMKLNPTDLTPEHLFDVLDRLAVRRTRSFVKRFYANDKIRIQGTEESIVFPTPKVRKVTYNLDDVLPGFFDRFEKLLATDLDKTETNAPSSGQAEQQTKRLRLAMYVPSKYRRDQATETHEIQLAGLLQSSLLKRFESSPHAFAETCRKMVKRHDAFLNFLEQGKIGSGQLLSDWIATDSEELEEYLSDKDEPLGNASEYHADVLRDHVKQDRRILEELRTESGRLQRSNDPNLEALVDTLAEIAFTAERDGIGQQDTRNRHKVIIFTYFADTVDWIFEHLQDKTETDSRLSRYKGRLARITGTSADSENKRDQVLWGFSPLTTDPPSGYDQDRYDIIVSTDMLAEGVNLQQAKHIINYDLPWNPMRIVQRHGRIDRIRSKHQEIVLHCVFPDSRLDDMLGLEERLQRKIVHAAVSVGVGEVLPEQEAQREANFAETREEINRLRLEDAGLLDRGSTTRGAMSGEEFRQETRAAFENTTLIRQIEALPWCAGSAMSLADSRAEEPGFVFCARVGDDPRPQFRFVSLSEDKPVSQQTLYCLNTASPVDGFETRPVELSEDYLSLAFRAWEKARNEIVEDWNFHSDKANLESAVTPRQQRAAELIEKHPPPGYTHQQIERLLDTVRAPHLERVVRALQVAINNHEGPSEQVQAIIKVVNDLGLQPHYAAKPRPEIAASDVHLVVWIAVLPDS